MSVEFVLAGACGAAYFDTDANALLVGGLVGGNLESLGRRLSILLAGGLLAGGLDDGGAGLLLGLGGEVSIGALRAY